MDDVKQYYKTKHKVGDEIAPLHENLANLVIEFPHHYNVFEFGCGNGKNLKNLYHKSTQFFELRGLDISENTISEAKQHCKGFLDKIVLEIGDEEFLKKYKDDYFHVSFTCSVLDHIPNIDETISQLKRISSEGIVIAETNDKINEFYFPHNYEKYGFKKQEYRYYSNGDHAFYEIWVWHKNQ